jgi:hypothetical protein
MKGLYFYNGNVYLVLRNISASYFFNKQGELNRELLNAWKEYLNADHILKTDNRFLFCETVPEPEWNEITNEIIVTDEEQLQPEQQDI